MYISKVNAKFLKFWMAYNFPEWQYSRHVRSSTTRSEYFIFQLFAGHPLRSSRDMAIRISDHKKTRRFQYYITTFRLGRSFEGDVENCLRSNLGRARKEIKNETRKLYELERLMVN